MTPMETQSIEEALKLIATKAPHLVHIDKILSRTNKAVVQFTVRIHNGKVTDIVWNQTERIKL